MFRNKLMGHKNCQVAPIYIHSQGIIRLVKKTALSNGNICKSVQARSYTSSAVSIKY